MLVISWPSPKGPAFAEPSHEGCRLFVDQWAVHVRCIGPRRPQPRSIGPVVAAGRGCTPDDGRFLLVEQCICRNP